MAITLSHTLIPAHEKVETDKLYSRSQAFTILMHSCLLFLCVKIIVQSLIFPKSCHLIRIVTYYLLSAKVSEKKILRASRAKAFITAAPPTILRTGR